MQNEARIVLDGRLEVHTDGSVYKIRPDGKVKSQCNYKPNNKNKHQSACMRMGTKAYLLTA